MRVETGTAMRVETGPSLHHSAHDGTINARQFRRQGKTGQTILELRCESSISANAETLEEKTAEAKPTRRLWRGLRGFQEGCEPPQRTIDVGAVDCEVIE